MYSIAGELTAVDLGGEFPEVRDHHRRRRRLGAGGRALAGRGERLAAGSLGVRVSKIGKISKFCKFLAGSFSAVSKRNFASKYFLLVA